MKDFILTLVVVFIIFRIIGSFRAAQIRRQARDYEEKSRNQTFEKDGTKVEIIKDKKKDDGGYTDYEIIEDDKQ